MKLKNIDHFPQDVIIVTADFVDLYSSISYAAGLEKSA